MILASPEYVQTRLTVQSVGGAFVSALPGPELSSNKRELNSGRTSCFKTGRVGVDPLNFRAGRKGKCLCVDLQINEQTQVRSHGSPASGHI